MDKDGICSSVTLVVRSWPDRRRSSGVYSQCAAADEPRTSASSEPSFSKSSASSSHWRDHGSVGSRDSVAIGVAAGSSGSTLSWSRNEASSTNETEKPFSFVFNCYPVQMISFMLKYAGQKSSGF